MRTGLGSCAVLLVLASGCKSKDNTPPVANAGPDRTVAVGELATLDGTESDDGDGKVSKYQWKIVSSPEGSTAIFDNEGAPSPTIATDLPGRYVMSLVVVDNDGEQSSADIAEISALEADPNRPEARLSASGDLGIDIPVFFDGSLSTAPEGRTLDENKWNYELVERPPEGTAEIQVGEDPRSAVLIPDWPGTWIVGLTVADEEESSRRTGLVLPVTETPNLAPIARCGSHQVGEINDVVTLDGTDSYDPEGQQLSYSWTLQDPDDNELALVDPETATPRFTTDEANDYTSTLVVNDGVLTSEPCQGRIVISEEVDNQPPIAFAGGDQGISAVDTVVMLDGSESYDPDGDEIASYKWLVLSAPPGSTIRTTSLLDADQPEAFFVPDLEGVFVIGLIVCDPSDLCAEDQAAITVDTSSGNTPPEANAGDDQRIEALTIVTLDGTASFDADGDPLTYMWGITGQPSGSTAFIDDLTADTTTIVPDQEGIYTIELVVDDGLSSDSDLMTIEAVPVGTNLPPVCEAGEDRAGDLGAPVLLDGSGTTDPNGDELTFLWVLLTVPEGSSATVEAPTALSTVFTPDVPGEYLVQFQAMDGSENCLVQFAVTVEDTTPNNPPECVTTDDLAVEVGEEAVLDATASTDPDEDPLTFSWTIVDSPAGSTATLTDADSATAGLIPDVAGVYQIALVVSDGEDQCERGVVITASETTDNNPPECVTTDDLAVEIGEAAVLDASASSDPDEDPLTFSWTIVDWPAGSTATLTDADSAIAGLIPDVAGVYQVALVVSDGEDQCERGVVITASETTENDPPLCRVSGPSLVSLGADAELDASATSDPDGDELTFAWSVLSAPDGATSTFDDDSAATTNWSATTEGLYEIGVVVSDGIDTCNEQVNIEVTAAPNTPPDCDAGGDLTAILGDASTLDGSASTDVDGDPLTYRWQVTEAPDGSAAEIADLTSAVTSFTADIAGSYTISLTVNDGTDECSTSITLTVESGNEPPTCAAGDDQTVELGNVVTLDSTGTSDPDGDALSYIWRVVERPDDSTAVIADLTLRIASFTPDVVGDYTIRLIVDDGEEECRDDISITVEEPFVNTPPDCDAGPDLTLILGEEATLDGRGTTDVDGDPLTYQWRVVERPSGSTATVSDLTLPVAGFIPDLTGEYTIRLIVDDGTDSCRDDTVITVEEEASNTPPDCDAGPDLTVSLGETATLDGRGTVDVDGDPLTYQWRVIERPSGSTAIISDLTLRVAGFTPDVAGDYTIRLIVDDGTDTCRDDMELTATDGSTGDTGGGGTGDSPPIADAGLPVTICAIDVIDLDGTDSSDPDGDSLSYAWSFASLPAGSILGDGDISGASSARPSFTPDVEGDFILTLEVSDSTTSDTDTVTASVDSGGALSLLHLDEGSGTVASDGSPTGLDGDITNPTWTGGRFFGALEFDGSSYVTVPDDDLLDMTDDFTIEFWMRTDSVGTTWSAILTKGTNYNYSMWLYQDELYFYGVTTALGYVTAGGVAASIGDGQWHHYAAVVSGGEVVVYEDGSILDTVTYSGTLRTNDTDVQIGRPAVTTSFYMLEGALDEVTIRSEALEDSDIENLASATRQVCTDDEDNSAPTASITSPSDGDSADIGYVRVEGTANDESAIVSLTVNGADAAATDTNYATWVAYVPLSEGSNTLSVRTEDVAGNINSSADSITMSFTDTCGEDTELLIAFDEDTPGTSTDFSDNGLDATEGGTATRAIGRFGNALRGDGGGYAQISHDDAISFDSAFSIELWFRRDGASPDWEILAHKGEPFNYGLALNSGFLVFGFVGERGGEYYVQTFGFADGDWHHVVGVFDGSEISLYVDGTLESSDSTGGENPLTNSDSLFIGAFQGFTSGLVGDIDQVRLYSDALSSSEIVSLLDEGEACPLGDNLAESASASASTTLNPVFTEDNVIDGNTDESSSFDYTMWLAENGVSAWVELDFGRVVGILEVRWANTHNRTSFDRATTDYRIEASSTGAFEAESVTIDTGTGELETDLVFHTALPSSPVAARYLRFYADDFVGEGAGINEIEVYGLE